MAWIKVIDEAEAEGNLKEMYERMIEPSGDVDNILKIHSLHPDSLLAHFDLYKTLMRGSRDLSRLRREMIAVVASSLNKCEY